MFPDLQLYCISSHMGGTDNQLIANGNLKAFFYKTVKNRPKIERKWSQSKKQIVFTKYQHTIIFH